MNIKDVMINVKRIRLSKNWKQKYLADELEVTEATYGRYESGHISMKLEHFLKLSKVFGMSVDEILNYNPDKPKEPDPAEILEKKMVNYMTKLKEAGYELTIAKEREESLKQKVNLLTEFNDTNKKLIEVLERKV